MREMLVRSRNAVPMLAGLAVMALVALLQQAQIGALERVGLQLFDQWQQAAPREYVPVPVKVVDIDADSLEALGQWPWPRTDLAELNRRLGAAGAKVVAYDVVFAHADRTSPTAAEGLADHDAEFAASMGEVPVVLGLLASGEDSTERPVEPKQKFVQHGCTPTTLTPYTGSIQPLEGLSNAASGLASLTYERDADEMVRKAPLLAMQDGTMMPTLSLEAVRVAGTGNPPIVRTSLPNGCDEGSASAVTEVSFNAYQLPIGRKGELWMHYTEDVQERVVSAADVLAEDASPEWLSEKFADHLVFVGASSAGLRDVVATPLDPALPGVLVHAQAAEQMLLGHFLERPDWARGMEFLLIVLLGGGLALLLPRLGAWKGAALGIGGIVAVIAASWFAFSRGLFLFDPTYPALAIAVVYSVQTVLTYYREERQRAYIHNAFDRYLSPELVKQIADDPDKLELGGEEREMTVLMCDIRGFSRISEQYSPREVIDFLTGFLTPMSDILIEHNATIDKYIGDAILAFWNAPLDDPDHYRHGARSALQMVAALEELNETMPGREGQTWPDDVSIGIGLNSGICCVGNMGSRRRLAYSLIGDTVNLAARLEGQTKAYGVPIIIGDNLARQLDGFAMLELDRIRVVGRKAPETIHALLGDETCTGLLPALQQAHREFLAAYRDQRWDDAEKILLDNGEGYAAAGLAQLRGKYFARMEYLRENPPPANWQGVYQAVSK